MHLNIAVCDDDKQALTTIENKLVSCSINLDFDYSIASYSSGMDLVARIQSESTFPFHIILLDIEMPQANGIEIAREILRNASSDLYLIFISNYPKYMQDSFAVHPFSYLTKPIEINNMYQTFKDILDRLSRSRKHVMVFDDHEKDIVISLRDIVYVSAPDSRYHQMTIFTRDSSFSRRGNLSEMGKSYPDTLFRIDRHTLISLLHIHYLTPKHVVMDTGVPLPISVRKHRLLYQYLQTHPVIPN